MEDETRDYKPASNSVDQLQVPVEPETLELGEDVEGGELGSSYFDNFVRKKYFGKATNFALGMYLLQVEDLDIRHPDLLHQGHIHWDQGIFLVSKLKRERKM